MPNRTFQQVAVGGNFLCATEQTTRDTYCCGDEFQGQLGNNDTARDLDAKIDQPVVRVVGNHKFAQLAPGYEHCCAIDEDGDAWCWG